MIQIYTGDGKGKTTAAFGLAMRAAGHGFKVRVIQFLKGSTYSGELAAADRLGIEVYQFGRTCPHAAVIKTGFMNCQRCGQCWVGLHEISDLDRHKTQMAWDLARDTVRAGQCDLLILDEILNAVKKDLVSLSDLSTWLSGIPPRPEVVLTGRNAPPELIEIADLVSEVKKIKHPYQADIKARRGIEY
ncbi:Adenosylcobalamin biosynthesis, ATP:cob(I)alamin adenosyltransferase CobA/CobO/ButR [Syntrophomonas zehnderi OL-4]|uniref:Adenosylcobalamin biosynthesis, ATP:cob(I)alamin adenosyltransferase CobA/CobO/ButR n=1 Tax=Syntrophomonas zehnderi OL-4 TaxID=690567 RepID=A0A0E4C9F3_9FIRM|nr:cob(I)yrinic acid a,c-diamide adenosyltransferase [Syntrophomonas zehnderi]CFX97861.1 Adenosylcobalamin biosynthesis, ATP:cob(I)alamin adenosyltransferase CobA/CobO/ButR [Syntrophomonas zehnderi OL-4]